METTLREIAFGKPIIGENEKKAVLEVLEGPILVHGKRSKKFEDDFKAFTGASIAVSLSSCTAGLHLCYFHMGLKQGDEVIVPAQTHTATVHAVEYCGAKPVFIDAELETGNIDIAQIEEKITEKTKAISIVHFLGMPVNMDRLNEIATKYNLKVIEDCALAIGSYFNNKHVGLHGDFGCFSFYPVKHMTTAEGGMLISKNVESGEKIQRQKAFGVDRNMTERTVPGVYDVTMLGYNYRMNEIQAALGIEQLKRLPDFLNKRRENYEVLSAGLKDIEEIYTFQSSFDNYQSSHYCFSAILNDQLASKRVEIVNVLKENGIGTSVYYPKPVPYFTYYKEKYNYAENDFPNASKISNNSISLPVGPHLDHDDMTYIIDTIKDTIYKFK